VIRESEITSTGDLIRRLNQLPNHFIFRGQANARWRLESSLERVVGKRWSEATARKFEDYSIQQFQSKFHLYDRENLQPCTKLAWLAVMQHYGVPTRLLDFTESPYVALYFALEAYPATEHPDFSVYAIDYTTVMERSLNEIARMDADFKETRQTLHAKQDRVFEEVVDRFSYNIAWIGEPKEMNSRLDRQAGSFLLSGNRARRIEDILNSDVYKGVKMFKFRIYHGLHTGVFALLRKININSKSVYGNLDGLAKSIRMEMQAHSPI